MNFFIDTSIFVDILRSKPIELSKSLFKSFQNINNGITSVITVAELCVGAYRSTKKDALNKTLKLLSNVHIVDLNKDHAIEGGRLYAELIQEGETIQLNDCLIAATSISFDIREIVTRDHHFNRIKGIKAEVQRN